jgi:hypothetical protein
VTEIPSATIRAALPFKYGIAHTAGAARSAGGKFLLSYSLVPSMSLAWPHRFFDVGALLLAHLGLSNWPLADIGNRPLVLLAILLTVLGVQLVTTGLLAELVTRPPRGPGQIDLHRAGRARGRSVTVEAESASGPGWRGRSWAPLSVLALIVAIGAALRLGYFLNGDPFVDEWATMLVARSIWERGLPILPSGTLYGHGMLYSYLDALVLGLLGWSPVVAQLPSLIAGLLTIPLVYISGRQSSVQKRLGRGRDTRQRALRRCCRPARGSLPGVADGGPAGCSRVALDPVAVLGRRAATRSSRSPSCWQSWHWARGAICSSPWHSWPRWLPTPDITVCPVCPGVLLLG